ncbi:MAG: hypothetical protein ABI183_26785 [Polyangiaceae bacterium]
MKRFIFAVALAGLTTSSTHAFAQERVATREATNKSARAASAMRVEIPPKSPAPAAVPPVAKSENGLTLVAPSTSGMVDEHPGQDLSDVHQSTSKTSTDSGADAHAVAMTVAASKVPRLIATPRLLRRMNADVVVSKLATAFHACYAEDPAEKTSDVAVVRVEIAASGVVERSSVEGGAKTTPQIAACILSSAGAGKFHPPGGIGTAVLVQVRTR